MLLEGLRTERRLLDEILERIIAFLLPLQSIHTSFSDFIDSSTIRNILSKNILKEYEMKCNLQIAKVEAESGVGSLWRGK
jgi:hypothetical protein